MSTAASRFPPAQASAAVEDEPRLLAQEPLAPVYEPHSPHVSGGATAVDSSPTPEGTAAGAGARASRVSDTYRAANGVPARGLVLLTVLAIALIAVADLALTSALTFFFDLCFVVVCLVATMAASRRGLFTAGVLPPLVLGALVAVLAVSRPSALASTGSFSQAFLTGLAAHAGALVAGYGVALLVVAARVSASRLR